MLDRRSIPAKLALAVGIPVAASLLFAVLALRTVEQVRIGGDQYDEVAEANDLRADILPPPFFIVESMVVAQLMVEASDQGSYEGYRAQLDTLERDYRSAQDRWLEGLHPDIEAESEMRRLLTEDAFATANEFYTLLGTDFYPAVEESIRRQDPEIAHEVLNGRLVPLYLAHRDSIVEAVPLVEARVAGLENAATDNAQRGVSVLVIALAALTVAALVLAALVVRAIVRPIRRLTRATDEVARVLRDADLDQEAPNLEPIDLNASRELNSAADSFNTLIGTTVDLLDRHARMRRNLGDIFQNLGRRNHGLLTRSLQVITDLEQTETNPETLDRLFRLDHLATRIRRNAENLLVLAGSQSARAVERQAGITDIIRSALSEIEAYTRVDRPELEPVAVKAGAVADVTHLLAELIENATQFSPPECRVRVVGAYVDDGYAVTVVDEGLGMRDDAIEEANQRIQKLSSLDLTPTRTLGLYVVGRLAQRHGIRVRLLEGSLRGMVAKVVLPRSILAEPTASDLSPDPDRARYERVLETAVHTGSRGGSELLLDAGPSYAAVPMPVSYPAPERRERPPMVAPPTRPSVPVAAVPHSGRPDDAYGMHTVPPMVAPLAAVPPMPAMAPAPAVPQDAGVEERSGMRRRVRGAQMPQTQLAGLGSPRPVVPEEARSEQLDHHRSSLRSFQQAVEQGTRDGRTIGEEEV